MEAGTEKGYLYTPGTNNDKDWYNFFSDSESGSIFYFKEVTNSANRNIYNIYLYRNNKDQETGTSGTKYYMVGAYNSSSTSIKDLSSTAINCFSDISSVSDSTDCWILVSQKERHQDFFKNQDSRFSHVPGTYLIYDDDFARKDQTVSYWKQADGTTELTQGWSSTIPSSSSTTTYYVGNGKTDDKEGQADNGTYMAANMVGANGTIQQTIENVFIPGWYEIRCNAITTSTKGKVVLFAQTGSGSATGKTSSEYDEAHVKQISERPSDYLAAAKEVDNDKYQISVCVKVSPKTTQEDTDETCNPLTFGVSISGGETSDLTTIDNFELIYRGTVVDKIILDEENEGKEDYQEIALTTSGTELQKNVNYMQAQNNIRTQLNMCEVYIKRTLNANQWNSIILPFRLTDGDVKAMWGEGAVVTEFKGARDEDNPHYIYFDKTTDGIYPGKLYLVKPTALNTTTLSSAVESSNAQKSDGTKITLAANTQNVYFIDAPRYGVDANEAPVTYTTDIIKGDTGKEWYEDESEILQFAGTYFKDTGNVPGNSYYIKDNKWYYSGTNVKNNSKGFRAWIQQASSNSAAKGFNFYIDGVNSTDDSVTGIERITNGDNTLPAQFDVYTIGGQKVRTAAASLDGLAKGVYIVEGKKYIVK